MVTTERPEELARLDVFVGEWTVEADIPSVGVMGGARSVFEWTLDGRFLVQRTETPIAEAPDAMMLVAPDPATGGYTQHYFDDRGIVRVYAMSFDGTVWRLLRETADFSPLPFRQRFTARVDGDTIAGAWEKSTDGTTWEHDLTLTYRRT